jgi:hypothetical protein
VLLRTSIWVPRKSAQVWSSVGIVIGFVVVAVVAVLLSRSRSSSGGPRAAHAAPARPRGTGGPRPAYFAPRPYPPPNIGVSFGVSVFVPAGPVPPIPWVEPTEVRLASRGWFDGDEVELTVELVDPVTGAVSWHRTLRDSIDPRDTDAVYALVERALEGEPFGQRKGVPPPRNGLPSAPSSAVSRARIAGAIG